MHEGIGAERDIYESQNDLKKSVNLYAKACRKFDGAGCYNYGRMMHEGIGAERDLASTHKAFDTSCYMKNALGCYALGYVYEHAQGVEFAIYDAYDGYSRACKLGNDDGCRALGFENYEKISKFTKNSSPSRRVANSATIATASS